MSTMFQYLSFHLCCPRHVRIHLHHTIIERFQFLILRFTQLPQQVVEEVTLVCNFLALRDHVFEHALVF